MHKPTNPQQPDRGRGSSTNGPGALLVAVTCAAILMFVGTGGSVLPALVRQASGSADLDPVSVVTLVLNVALVLFGWRKCVQLKKEGEARAAVEDEAAALAYKDYTTGLHNRRYLSERLAALCSSTRKEAALLVLDLDHFKQVNDLYGHAAGDEVLIAVSSKLIEYSPEGSCCVRLGGDEFAVLVFGAHARNDSVEALARSLLSDVSRPIPISGNVAHVSASLGAAHLTADVERPEILLRRADIAMYEAKRLGRNRFSWFEDRMERDLNARNLLEADLRSGIAAGQFVPFFQPLISLGSKELKGFEVLARWHHPTRGLVEPTEFIPIAETTGVIAELTFSVMRQALLEAKHWKPELTIAINISPLQFKDPQLAQRILKLLAETNFPPQRLEIEITESALMDDAELARATLESLKNTGIQISLDDFGTGYASLTQLRSLPFDRIKIDRSFVAAVLDDAQSGVIVTTIANMGRSLCLPITAEGIETDAVRQKIEDLGCSDGQGWLFGKAIPMDEVCRTFAVGTETAGVPPIGEILAQAEVPAAVDRRSAQLRGRRSAA